MKRNCQGHIACTIRKGSGPFALLWIRNYHATVNLSLKVPPISTLLPLFLALVLPAAAQVSNGGGNAAFSPAPYRIGERLTYNVDYSNFPSAAHVQLQVVSRGVYFGRDAIQLQAHVETTGVINVALFAINNDYTTFIDPGTGLPIRSQLITHEGTRSYESFVDFGQIADPETSSAKQPTIGGTYDFLSAFYRMRALPLAEGASYSLSVRGEGTTYSIELKIVNRESVKTSVGSFNTLVAQARTSNNTSLRDVKVYFSDDDRHLPVLLTAKVGSGELRAELASTELITPPPIPVPTPTAQVVPAASPTPLARPTPGTVAINEEWPFKVGEQLNYQVFLGSSNVAVGVANFQVSGRSRYFDQEGLLVSVKAQTSGAAARLFVANDQINSYVDPKSLLPYRTEFNLVEGRRRVNQTVTFNQDNGSATTGKGEKIDIPVGTHDYISFFYAVRTFDLNPPRRNAISMLVENKPKTLFISSVKREVIQLSNQKIPAIALALTTDDPQSDKYQFRLWVSDDKRRLPLRITCATELGPLRADLVILPTIRQ
jgi:Protein of unknown function (DUF3108)